jgi:hypothetical protein
MRLKENIMDSEYSRIVLEQKITIRCTYMKTGKDSGVRVDRTLDGKIIEVYGLLRWPFTIQGDRIPGTTLN